MKADAEGRCKHCGNGNPGLMDDDLGPVECINTHTCRDRCADQRRAVTGENSALRNAIVTLRRDNAALREMLGEYREELRLDVSNCHCDRVGRECCCSTCRANISQIDRINALLLTPTPTPSQKAAPKTGEREPDAAGEEE